MMVGVQPMMVGVIQGRNNVRYGDRSWTWITRSWSHGRHKNGAL